MASRYIQVDGTTFRIRGPYTAKQLRDLYQKTLAAYPGTKLTLRGWLVGYGKVHSSLRKDKK